MDNKLNVILVADDDHKRTKGLMFHRPLSEKECALFYFASPGKHSFWNKNVGFPISVIFCDDDGTVEDVKYLSAEQTSAIYPDSHKIKYVVEAHNDLPSMMSVKKGSKIKIKGQEVFFE